MRDIARPVHFSPGTTYLRGKTDRHRIWQKPIGIECSKNQTEFAMKFCTPDSITTDKRYRKASSPFIRMEQMQNGQWVNGTVQYCTSVTGDIQTFKRKLPFLFHTWYCPILSLLQVCTKHVSVWYNFSPSYISCRICIFNLPFCNCLLKHDTLAFLWETEFVPQCCFRSISVHLLWHHSNNSFYWSWKMSQRFNKQFLASLHLWIMVVPEIDT